MTDRPSPALLAARIPPPRAAAAFGRVDTDGNVHLRLPDGAEKIVGQCAPHAVAAGLDLFARRYEDLRAEIDLTSTRLTDGKVTPDAARAVVTKARQAIAEPAMVGDLSELASSVDELDVSIAAERKARQEHRAAERAAALTVRQGLVAEAERAAESTQWKSSGDRLKELLEEWKTAPHADRTAEQELWTRLRAARATFDRRRRAHFATLEVTRAEATVAKTKLVKEAVALTTSKDWKATTQAYRDLLTRWKAAGQAGRVDDDALWQQFKSAQDAFFAARNAISDERNQTEVANLRAKEELAKAAEAIAVDKDVAAAKSSLRNIQDRWEKIGHVPRGDRDAVENRLRRVEDAVRQIDQEKWKRSNPTTTARASAVVEQFDAALADLTARREKLVAAGGDATDIDSRIESTRGLRDAASSHLPG